jgi:hypothetical protein
MTREPPNQRLADRLEDLKQLTESTISVEYHGGSLFVLTSRDGNFWNSVFDDLRRHNFDVQKHVDGELYVEKGKTKQEQRDLERRNEAAKEQFRQR